MTRWQGVPAPPKLAPTTLTRLGVQREKVPPPNRLYQHPASTPRLGSTSPPSTQHAMGQECWAHGLFFAQHGRRGVLARSCCSGRVDIIRVPPMGAPEHTLHLPFSTDDVIVGQSSTSQTGIYKDRGHLGREGWPRWTLPNPPTQQLRKAATSFGRTSEKARWVFDVISLPYFSSSWRVSLYANRAYMNTRYA